MSIHVTPQVEKRIQDWIARGPYRDADAVIDKALEALDAQEQAKLHTLRELVHAGFTSGNRVEFTDEVWDEMDGRVDERFARGEKQGPHAGP